MTDAFVPFSQRLDELEAFVRGRSDLVPRVGLVLGSGLGDLADEIEDPVGGEFREVTDQMQIGQAMDEAMWASAKRLGIPVYHMEAGNRCFDDRVPEEVNRRIIDLNLTSTIMSCRTFTPQFKKQKFGKILNVSSACDRRSWPGWSVYSAAKAAVNAFTRCLYTELRPHGIGVMLLVPGGSNTGFQAAAAGADTFEWDEELAVRPEHFADMVYQTCALTKGGVVTELVLYGLAQDVSGY